MKRALGGREVVEGGSGGGGEVVEGGSGRGVFSSNLNTQLRGGGGNTVFSPFPQTSLHSIQDPLK